jgi:hypothetical protein
VRPLRLSGQMPIPALGEPVPREVLAGVLLAQGRDVRMADDPRLGNVMAGQDLVAELDQRIDLGSG